MVSDLLITTSIILVIFVILQVISTVRYLLVDERPILPKGYVLLTDGEKFKWRKYSPLMFFQYTTIFPEETKESAIEDAWDHSTPIPKKKFTRVTPNEKK